MCIRGVYTDVYWNIYVNKSWKQSTEHIGTSDEVSTLGLGLETRLVSRPIFASLSLGLGLEGFMSRLGLKGYRSRSQACCV